LGIVLAQGYRNIGLYTIYGFIRFIFGIISVYKRFILGIVLAQGYRNIGLYTIYGFIRFIFDIIPVCKRFLIRGVL
jgi:hypothetical protein